MGNSPKLSCKTCKIYFLRFCFWPLLLNLLRNIFLKPQVFGAIHISSGQFFITIWHPYIFYENTVELLNKSAHGAAREGISENCGTPTLYRKARSLEMNPVVLKTSTVVGVLFDHGLREAPLLRTLLLRSPTV